MHVDMHMYMHVYQVSTPISLYTYLNITEQIWLPHCNHQPQSLYPTCDIEPSFLHKYAKTQPTAISISHAIAKYGPATNMHLKCHIYVTYVN